MNGTALALKEVHSKGEVTTAVDNEMGEDIAVVDVVAVVVADEEAG